mmetsp:Transcript_8147/g.20828  ORF Transcript_8147/g.20828 Transcript_8147/m.20828 type:complete len:80 (+) Transcript_8147:190-429(+)
MWCTPLLASRRAREQSRSRQPPTSTAAAIVPCRPESPALMQSPPALPMRWQRLLPRSVRGLICVLAHQLAAKQLVEKAL